MQLPALLRQHDIDIFFSPGGLLPRSLPSKMLTVVTFQNMLPFDHVQRKKYPFGYRRLRDWLLERGLSSAMCRADLVIFISEFARNFIAKHVIPSNPFIFHARLYWKNKIKFKILNPSINSDQPSIDLDNFSILEQTGFIKKSKKYSLSIIRVIFTQKKKY